MILHSSRVQKIAHLEKHRCLCHPMGKARLAGIKRNAEEMSSKSGTVRASHILVKHRDSRRPSSWKEQNVTRSKVGLRA